MALACAASGAAAALEASPIPTLHPGGANAPPDTTVLEFPVRRAPALLTLQALAPLAALSLRPDPSPTLLRRESVPALAPPPSGGSELKESAAADALVISGTKSLAVEVGRGRDASLKQALDLTLRGRVAGDVEVAATLSDQRLPFTPDGATRELEDLDRVSLSIRAPHGEATLGDFRMEGIPGEYARITRALQGVRGEARVRGIRWDVAAASPKGERRSFEFRGEEGKQGPYALLGRGAEAEIGGIVAGSEAVWLDGAKQRRGADLDYIMDYAAGTITFTVRHPVTSTSRIAADFEAATGRYRRTFYAATTRREWKRGGGWYASYVREGDDARSPLGASLTAADRSALGALGDSVGAPVPSGIRYLGPGNGSYVWDESDPARGHWLWLGAGRGDYEVEFSAVGAGRGAYADTLASDGTRFYHYMGSTLGSFEPGRALAVPRENALIDLGGSTRLFRSLGLEGELARSGFDRNALSSIDDGDNAGSAGRLSARLDPRPIRLFGAPLGAISASASIRARDDRFAALDRLDASFEGDRWNQSASLGGERRQELSLAYDPIAALGLRGELGMRALSGGSRATRRAALLEVRALAPGTLRWEEARNRSGEGEGRRARWSADFAREKGPLLPKLSAALERIEGQEGDSADARRSRLWSAGLGWNPSTTLLLRSSFGWRWDETRLGASSAASVARTWDGGILARAKSGFAAEASFSRRRVAAPGGIQSADLAQLVLSGGRAGGPVSSELRYDVTQLREPVVTRSLVSVEPGAGSYDAYGNASLGGGYELVSEAGEPVTRSRGTIQVRIDAYPGRAAGGRVRGPLRALGLSSSLRLETLSALPLGRAEQMFRFNDYLAAETTFRGSLTARQTLEYVPQGSRLEARLEVGARKDVSGEVVGLRSRGDGFDARLRVRHALPLRIRATATTDLARNVSGVSIEEGNGSYQSKIRGRGYELELARPLGRVWTVTLLSRHRRDADLSRGGYQDAWSAGPTARCAGERLRLDGKVFYGRLDQTGAYAPASRYLIAPLGARVDFDLLGEYRVADRVALAVGWNGSRVDHRPATYSGRLELRSTF